MPTNAKPEQVDQPEAKPPAKRRWYQFSLWSMFVWVTVIGVGLTLATRWIAPAQQQRTTVLILEGAGGSVRYADGPAGENRLTTKLRDWLPRDYFDPVVQVSFQETPITNAALEPLSRLPQLQGLIVQDGTQITNTGMTHLSGLKQLQMLVVHDGHQITDEGLAHLSSLQQLRVLRFVKSQVTDEGLTHLSGLTQLQRLWLSGSFSEAGKDQLQAALPGCNIGWLEFR